MSYATVEALWLARLRAMPQFSSENSSRGNWGIRNSGRAAQYAILKPGEHERQMIGFSTRQTTWRTVIQLWQRYKDDGDSLTDLVGLVDAVLTELDRYPHLGDVGNTVFDAEIVTVRETVQTPADAPAWLYTELIGVTNEQEEISFAE